MLLDRLLGRLLGGRLLVRLLAGRLLARLLFIPGCGCQGAGSSVVTTRDHMASGPQKHKPFIRQQTSLHNAPHSWTCFGLQTSLWSVDQLVVY